MLPSWQPGQWSARTPDLIAENGGRISLPNLTTSTSLNIPVWEANDGVIDLPNLVELRSPNARQISARGTGRINLPELVTAGNIAGRDVFNTFLVDGADARIDVPKLTSLYGSIDVQNGTFWSPSLEDLSHVWRLSIGPTGTIPTEQITVWPPTLNIAQSAVIPNVHQVV